MSLRASKAGRIRCLRLGIQDVHAVARGVPIEGLPRPAGAVRLRYRIAEPGFRAEGVVVVGAAAAWFEADGTAWRLSPADETVMVDGRARCDCET